MSQYGVCEQCGGEKVLNPKTGKIFCKNKCWLNKTQTATYTKQTQPVANLSVKQPIVAPNWDKIRQEKSEDIRASVALKGAIDLVTHSIIDKDSWEDWANVFYNYTPNIKNPF